MRNNGREEDKLARAHQRKPEESSAACSTLGVVQVSVNAGVIKGRRERVDEEVAKEPAWSKR